MLGVKLGGGAPAKPGAIVVRQRGTRVHAGPGVGMVSSTVWVRFAAVVLGERRGTKGERENRKTHDEKTSKSFGKKTQLQGRDHTLFALVPGRVSFEWDHRAKRRSVRIVEDGS